MTTVRNVTKSSAVMEDLATGVGSVLQKRGTGRLIDVPLTVSSVAELNDIDTSKYTLARVCFESSFRDYIFVDNAWTPRKHLEEVLKITKTPTDNLTKVSTFAGDVDAVYEVRKNSDNSLTTIYSDKDGVTSIPQNGTANVSNGDAEVVFYIADGDYTVTVNAVSATISIGDGVLTAPEILSSNYDVGRRLTVTDRGDSVFIVTNGGTANGYDVLDAGAGNTAVLKDSYPFVSSSLGLIGNGSDETGGLSRFAALSTGKDSVLRKPPSFFKISSTLDFAENTELDIEKLTQIIPTTSFADGTYTVNVGKDSHVKNLYVSDIIDKRFTIHGIRAVEGSPVAQGLTLDRPIVTRMNQAIYLRGHNNTINSPSLFSNIYGIYVGSTPSETEPGGPSGSVSVFGGRINDNHTGIYQSLEGIDAYYQGVILEYNRRHIDSRGRARISNSYLLDAASVCFDGDGHLDLVNTDMTCLGMGTSRLDAIPDGWDNTNSGSDFATAINIKTANLVNSKFYTGQRNIAPRDRTALFGSTTVTLTNCSMEMKNEFSGVGQLCIAKSPFTVKETVITPESTTKQNYISNGLFQNAGALTATYINGTFTVDPNRGNPWGGGCLNVFRGGIRMKYSVPNWSANKKYLLMVLKGSILSGAGQATGVDMTNSTVTNYTPPQITTNKTVSGNAVCVGGQTYADRETIGVTTFVVELDSADGQINLTNTLTVTTGNEQVYGVVLCDLDSNDIDYMTHVPIGYYVNGGLIVY